MFHLDHSTIDLPAAQIADFAAAEILGFGLSYNFDTGVSSIKWSKGESEIT